MSEEMSFNEIQAQLMMDYYMAFSKYARGRKPEKKIAWVTSFTPIEILEALDIAYYYPESYAAVVAASGKEQKMLEQSEMNELSLDCCGYSCCIEGCLELQKGPRGIPPLPDVLIATNNQCNTLPNWWNILAKRYHVPLIVLDYPGERGNRDAAMAYVKAQHENLIQQLEKLTGKTIDLSYVNELIENSCRSIAAWNRIVKSMHTREISPTELFDGIVFLILSRCKPLTQKFYKLMAQDMEEKSLADRSKKKAFWLGYPLWYHPKRYLEELLADYHVVGSNYITWWSLDYSGKDVFERLFKAYNYTFLNLSQETRNRKLQQVIQESGADFAVTVHNKSCKCDYVSARGLNIPQAELSADMIDRNFLDVEDAKRKLDLIRSIL